MAHNPEVTGSNPVPATKKTQVRKGSAECGPPSSSPTAERTSNTRPHGEDASSFVDIADEQIRDHADEELNSGPQPSSLNAEAAGATPWGRVASARGGELVLDRGPDLRRWDKKILGQTHRLLVQSRDRATSSIGHSIQIIAVGVRAFPAWDRGAEESVAHHPYEPPRGDIFRRRGCGGSRWLSSNHVSIDSSRGRFA